MKWVGIFPVDINLLRSNPDVFREAFRKRFLDPTPVDKALELDRKWRETQRKVDEIRSIINKLSRIYGFIKQYGKEELERKLDVLRVRYVYEKIRDKLEKEGIEIIKKEVEELQKQLHDLEREADNYKRELIKILYVFPNFVEPEVPEGPDDSYNVPIGFWGIPRVWAKYLDQFKEQTEKHGFKIVEVGTLLREKSYEKYIKDRCLLEQVYESLKGNRGLIEVNFNDVLDFNALNKDKLVPYVEIQWEPKHHYDLVKEFNLADTDTAAKISGSRFYIEKGALVFLDFALSLYGLEFYKNEGYNNVIIPPYLMKREVEERITYFEAFKEAIYHVKEEDLILITTSEHPIVAIYMDHIFDEKELPLRILAWSPAFRKEAGSHGKDTKGIFRTHQFHKVELHIITTLDKDKEALQELLKVFEEFMQSLNLPYRIVKLSSGDMDKRATIQYDLEAWFPGQGKYRELGSLATMSDWVSRKVNIRVRRKGKMEFVANLYSTGVAVQRTLCSIFENYYDPCKDRILVPTVLRKYAGFVEIKK